MLVTTRTLPPDFITTAEAAELRGFTVRTARNRCLNHHIAIKAGREWWVYVPGLMALAANDTGALADAEAWVHTFKISSAG